jgi:D-threo-aldose 1-dehydrogenase
MRWVPRDKWVLSTKVGRLLRPRRTAAENTERHHPLPFDPVYDYSYDGVMRSFEDSLQRLGLARIDILYVHDIGAMQHGQEAHPRLMRTLRDGGYRALENLRAAGTVRAIGIGVNEREMLVEAMEWGDWDAFLLAGRYTLLEQAPLEDLIPKCEKAGTSIVVGGPLNSGILAGRDTWNYKAAPPEIVARVNAIEAVCDSHRVPLAAAALQFPLAHPAVAAVIPGPRNVEEFHANVRLLRYPIPAALWSDLRAAGLLHPHAPTPAG